MRHQLINGRPIFPKHPMAVSNMHKVVVVPQEPNPNQARIADLEAQIAALNSIVNNFSAPVIHGDSI